MVIFWVLVEMLTSIQVSVLGRRGERGTRDQGQGDRDKTYRLPGGRDALVHNPFLHKRHPPRHARVEHDIERDGRRGPVLCAVKAELVVPREAGGGREEGRVAEREAHVDKAVGLLELEGVEVVWDRVVGGVL